jgi:hypothetical protein
MVIWGRNNANLDRLFDFGGMTRDGLKDSSSVKKSIDAEHLGGNPGQERILEYQLVNSFRCCIYLVGTPSKHLKIHLNLGETIHHLEASGKQINLIAMRHIEPEKEILFEEGYQ